jgi:hypothetical protein
MKIRGRTERSLPCFDFVKESKFWKTSLTSLLSVPVAKRNGNPKTQVPNSHRGTLRFFWPLDNC